MRLSLPLAFAALLTAPAALAQTLRGGGPYPATYTTDRGFARHTIYRPITFPSFQLPILVWGNGACSADGTYFEKFLTHVASHGYLVIANGAPGGRGQSSASWLTQSFDWAERAARSGDYAGKIDPSKIVVAGQSCGGIEAYEVSNDPRITSTGIWNSGLMSSRDAPLLRRLTKPVFYFLGGDSDIAYRNGERDYDDLPRGLPAFKANLDVGHYGTFRDTNGGEFGNVAVNWLNWQLKGNITGRDDMFEASGMARRGWQIEHKNFDF